MGRKILVVEDSKTSRREIVRLVQERGFTALEAENGRSGLEMIKDRTDIALVFCDLNMPEMNGLEFAAAFRQETHYKDTPFIMMAQDKGEAKSKEASSSKVTAWLSKPADATSIASFLDKYCG